MTITAMATNKMTLTAMPAMAPGDRGSLPDSPSPSSVVSIPLIVSGSVSDSIVTSDGAELGGSSVGKSLGA